MESTIDIVEKIVKAKNAYIKEKNDKPSTLVVDPYTAAALRDHLGMSDFDELKSFKNMKIAVSIHNEGEFKVL
jgi:hypothetical protein